MPISNPASFRAEAKYQGRCQYSECGSTGAWHPHHVVDRGWLKARKLPQNDPRNAMRLCTHCHMQHEWGGVGKVEIPLIDLPVDSVCYAFEVMGDAADVWLRRHYVGEDARLDLHLQKQCELCRPAAL